MRTFPCPEKSNNDDGEDEGAGRGRRSGRTRQRTGFFAGAGNDDDDDDDAGSDELELENEEEEEEDAEEEEEEEEEAPAARRKSSRSTAFRGEMKDPSNSIADLLKMSAVASGDGGKKRRGSRQRSSLESRESDDDADDDVVAFDSPPARRKKKAVVKSPAKRHSKRRTTKRVEYPESSEEEQLTSEEEDEEDEEEEEEEEEMRISKIIACKSMTLSEWEGVCAKMNTTEITKGSRWIQEDSPIEAATAAAAGGFDKYEERFLVKWDDRSYLHCSWETERDLVEFCDGAKNRLSTFFRKAEGGCLYVADERLDGVSNRGLVWGCYTDATSRFVEGGSHFFAIARWL